MNKMFKALLGRSVVLLLAFTLAAFGATSHVAASLFEPGALYAGNEGDSSIVKIEADGTGQTIFASGVPFGGPFTMTALAFDPKGEFLYFARPSGTGPEGGDGKIWRLDAQGNAILFADKRPNGSFLNAFGLAFSPDGTLHALLLGPTQIVSFDAEGNATLVHDTSQFAQTIGFAISSSGELFWSDVDAKTVRRATGPTTSEIFADASDGLERPTGLAFDRFGRLYVADFVASAKVFRFDGPHSGTVIADASVGAFAPIAVVVDRLDNLYAANFCIGQASTILKLTLDGAPTGPQPFADLADGLRCTRSLAVMSEPLLEAIQNLIADINSLDLPTSVEISLTGPLNEVVNILCDNNPNNDAAACGELGAFINQVNAKEKNGQLTPAEADGLRQSAEANEASLGCP